MVSFNIFVQILLSQAYNCRLQLKHDSPSAGDLGLDSFDSIRSESQPLSMTSEMHINAIDTVIHKRDVGNTNVTSGKSTGEEESVEPWKCHKCERLVSGHNKRCPLCCSWRGGKRNIVTVKKSDSENCPFCQLPFNPEGICVMCLKNNNKTNGNIKIKSAKGQRAKTKSSSTNSHGNEPQTSDAESNWECHKCSRINDATSKRCKCNAWRGGKRQLYFKRKNADEKNDSKMT